MGLHSRRGLHPAGGGNSKPSVIYLEEKDPSNEQIRPATAVMKMMMMMVMVMVMIMMMMTIGSTTKRETE